MFNNNQSNNEHGLSHWTMKITSKLNNMCLAEMYTLG